MYNVCFTALFGPYEDLKQPSVYTDTWAYYCFTDQPVTSNIWRIIPTTVESLWRSEYGIPKDKWTAKHAARFIKIAHPAIGTWDKSFWADASFRIDVNLDDWWRTNMQGYLSAPAHPLRDDWWTEIWACIDSKRCDLTVLRAQMEAYKHLPRNAGVIQSGLLMRTPEAVPLCTAWWEELCKWSTRDQVAFCNVAPHFEHHTYRFDYTKEKDFIYEKHYKNR